MPEPITTAIILAKVGEHVLTFLSERGEDSAADRVAEWLKAPEAERAAERTAGHFPQYDALRTQLSEWARRPSVAAILVDYRASTERRLELLAPLKEDLEATGFDATPGGPDAFQVIEQFFADLSACFLESENATHSTARVIQEFKATAAPQNAKLASIGEQISALAERIQAPPTDVVAEAEALLASGRPQAALDLIEQLRKRGTATDEYKALATRGNALLQLNRLVEANQSFRDALTLRPTRPNAIANVALCSLYRGDLDDADQLATRALALEDGNAQALRVKAQVLSRREKWDEALSLAEKLAEPWERDYLVGSLLLHRGYDDDALVRLQQAHEIKPDEPWLALRYASALLSNTKKLAEQADVAPWGKHPAELSPRFANAEALLDSAVAQFEHRTTPEGLVDALAQRALLRSYLGIQGAKDDFDRIAAIRSPLDEHLLEHAANFWNTRGDAHRTIEAVEAYRRTTPPNDKIARLYALALGLSRRADDGIAILRSLPPNLENSLALVDLMLQAGDIGSAQQQLDSISETQHGDWRVAVRQADVQAKRGEPEVAISTLQQASEIAGTADRWRIRLMLAELLAEKRDWPAAAEEYRHVISVNSPAHFIASYMAALFNTGEVDAALALARSVRERRGCLPEVVRSEAQMLDMLGRLQESDDLYRQLLDVEPGDALAKLHRAFIAFRQGKHSEALALLPSAQEVAALAWDDGFQVAVMRSWLGDPMGALAAAYMAFHTHAKEHEAHLAYLQVFFSVDSLVEDKLHPETAGPGTWVTIEVRGRQAVHQLLHPGEEKKESNQHATSDKFSRAIAGKRKDALFELDENTHETARVVEIRDRYVGLLQEIMQNFETAFPGVHGLRAFSFRGAEDFPVIQEVMAAKRQHGEEVAAQYRTMPMPLAMLARLLGMTDLEAWYAVMANEEFHPVLVADGSAEAQVTAARLATGRDSDLVLETSGIAALAELEMLHHLPRLGRPVHVAQTVVDVFEQARLKVEELLRRGTSMTIEEKGGQLFKSERPKESLEAALALHTHTLEWLRDPANCTISGVHEGHGTTRWSIRSMLSAPSADSMALAREHNAVLVSEDLRLRGLCENEYGRPGIASPHVLAGLLQAEAITQEAHDLAFVRTVQWGYYFSPVNDRIMDCAFRADGYSVGARFRAVVDCLTDPTADLGPVVNCAALFLKRLKLHAIASAGGSVVVYIFSALLRRGHWSATERLLRLRLSQIMILLPVHHGELQQELDLWKASQRFLS